MLKEMENIVDRRLGMLKWEPGSLYNFRPLITPLPPGLILSYLSVTPRIVILPDGCIEKNSSKTGASEFTENIYISRPSSVDAPLHHTYR